MANWASLPAELLGVIFGNLVIKERCKVVPFICKAFDSAHRAHPPLKKYLDTGEPNPNDFRLFSLVASGVEELRIATPSPLMWDEGWEDQAWGGCRWSGDSPFDEWEVAQQLLTKAAKDAPNLQKLVFDFKHHSEDLFLSSLPDFSSLTSLEFRTFFVDPDPNNHMFGTVYSDVNGETQGCKYMAGMHFLKEFCIRNFDICGGYYSRGETPHLAVTKEWVEALWRTLADIKTLRKLDLRIHNHWDDSSEDPWRDCPDQHIFQPMSQLTQIRELRLDLQNNGCRDWGQRDGFMDSASFGQLTQLTKLQCSFMTSTAVYQSISNLVLLKELTLGINFMLPDLPILSLKLPQLSRLKVEGILSSPTNRRGVLEHLLPTAKTAFPSLVALECSNMVLDSFPAAFALMLTGLTSLALPGNRIQRLPSTLTCFQSLRVLDMSENADLQLRWEDLDMFLLLPELQTVDVHRRQTPSCYVGTKGHWDVQSLYVWSSLKGRLPHLDVIGAEPAGTKAY